MTDARPDQEQAGLSRRGFLGRAAVSGAAVALGSAVSGPGHAVAAPGKPPGPPGGPVRATGLTTEYAPTLLGTDVAKPRLGWVLESGGHNARQTAYQVQVASTEPGLARGKADVWDSGRVTSEDSLGVEYDGPALEPRTRYYWRTRVWDGQQKASPWSPATWFETAMTDPAEWVAAWVGAAPSELAPLTLIGASWIWSQGATTASAPVGTRYFRARHSIPAGTTVSRLAWWQRPTTTSPCGWTVSRRSRSRSRPTAGAPPGPLT